MVGDGVEKGTLDTSPTVSVAPFVDDPMAVEQALCVSRSWKLTVGEASGRPDDRPEPVRTAAEPTNEALDSWPLRCRDVQVERS